MNLSEAITKIQRGLIDPLRIMNTKQKGRRQDVKSCELFLKNGATDTCISAASLGTFDVIAWGKTGCTFVQNKTNSLPPKDEMLGLIRAIVPANAIKLLLVWKDFARFPDFYLINTDGLFPKPKEEAIIIMKEVFGSDGTERNSE